MGKKQWQALTHQSKDKSVILVSTDQDLIQMAKGAMASER